MVSVRGPALVPAVTTVRVADTPTADVPEKAPQPDAAPQDYEVGGVSVIVSRTAPAATFAALSVPTSKGRRRSLARYARLSEGEDHVAVAVDVSRDGATAAWTDYVLLRWGEVKKPVAVEFGGNRIVYANYGLVRVHPDRVEAWGDLRHLRLRTDRTEPALVVNGRKTRAALADGVLTFGPAGGSR